MYNINQTITYYFFLFFYLNFVYKPCLFENFHLFMIFQYFHSIVVKLYHLLSTVKTKTNSPLIKKKKWSSNCCKNYPFKKLPTTQKSKTNHPTKSNRKPTNTLSTSQWVQSTAHAIELAKQQLRHFFYSDEMIMFTILTGVLLDNACLIPWVRIVQIARVQLQQAA